MGFRTPTRYGRYEIVGPLATGGMADLLLARARGPEGFETLAVVKRIRPHLARSPEFVRLFLREAKLAAQLRHQNIVHVYDAGQERGQYYFVMEYVHGRDLRALLQAAAARNRAIALDEALSIAVGVCAGLHHAHERLDPDGAPLGIVHRDVSPSNVLVSFDGAVKLADFGIAKATLAAVVPEAGTNSMRGKAGYMSPEQCLGQKLDRRSDLYALSVVLYELTCGDRPYPVAANEFLTIKQTLEEPVRPPSKLRADYPPELERIVLAGLERDRERRTASAREMGAALEAFARRNQLAISTATVAQLVDELFGDDLRAWETAQRGGKTLSQHLTETGTVSMDHLAELAPRSVFAPSAPSPRRAIRIWGGRALALVAAVGAATVIRFTIRGHGVGANAAPVAGSSASRSTPAPSAAAETAPKPPPAPPAARVAPTSAPPRAHAPQSPSRHKTRRSGSTSWDPEAPVLPH